MAEFVGDGEVRLLGACLLSAALVSACTDSKDQPIDSSSNLTIEGIECDGTRCDSWAINGTTYTAVEVDPLDMRRGDSLGFTRTAGLNTIILVPGVPSQEWLWAVRDSDETILLAGPDAASNTAASIQALVDAAQSTWVSTDIDTRQRVGRALSITIAAQNAPTPMGAARLDEYAGCNTTTFVLVEVGPDLLTMRRGTTEAPCNDEEHAQDDAAAALLEEVTGASLENDVLTLHIPGGEIRLSRTDL